MKIDKEKVKEYSDALDSIEKKMESVRDSMGQDHMGLMFFIDVCTEIVNLNNERKELIIERDKLNGVNLTDIPLHDDPAFAVEINPNGRNPNFKNVLVESESIIFNRDSEKERQYGPFKESMERAANIASNMIAGKTIETEDMYKCMIALKMSRLTYNHKYDTFLDGIGYIAGLEDYCNGDS